MMSLVTMAYRPWGGDAGGSFIKAMEIVYPICERNVN